MTRLLLTVDDYIYKYQGHYFAASQERMDFYQRYLRVFDKVKIVARCEERDELNPSWISISADNRIEIVAVPFFRGPKAYALKYFQVGSALHNVAEGCDAAILRIPSTVAFRASTAVKKANIPYAVEIVFDAVDAYKNENNLFHKFLWWKIHRDMSKLSNGADGVSCVTQFYMQKHYYSLKPNAFDAYYSSLSLDSSFYTAPRTSISSRPIVLGHVSNHVEYKGRKGQYEVIQVVKKLVDQGIDVSVQFVGRDAHNGFSLLKSAASRMGIADRVCFMGYLSRAELDKYLDNVDIFVFPTSAEGLPRVVIEAMAKGIPCIATKISGNAELLDSEWLFDNRTDVKAMTELCMRLITNESVYKEVSQQNFQRSLQYEADLLQTRRDLFYEQLKGCINR